MQWAVIAVLLVVLVVLIRLRTYEPFVMNEIPKVIWTFWDKDELPEIVQKSVENWKKHCPGFEVVIVNMSNVSQFLPEIDIESFRDGEFIQRKSDMVRLALIAKYGGIWSDASIATKKSYDWIIEEQKPPRKTRGSPWSRIGSLPPFPILILFQNGETNFSV
jgi:mannosyltransferase OCH1-like enzyme